ncbi:poly(U)-specific 3'-to-5' RNA exonuclease [Tulasnella sp. JGI-2019a]|nr:poly(U)-specific 3'-to-5' RNA exonuclease [Tulasnella sp. JGI-2019a]KAG9036759.1 poly(U)-specific 3'-to-5' RNA exonuclease [Tulasnella sp. JGI-2019a]
MKRKQPIVDYGSSGDENEPEVAGGESTGSVKPPKRLKELMSLPETFEAGAPADNATLHQGRQRTRPHVEGQFVAHIYIPVQLRGRLKTLLAEIVDHTRTVLPSLQSFISEDSKELHISLSRPTYLRAHQREGLNLAVKAVCRKYPPFALSFARIAVLNNDEKTRTFLALEVGAGYLETKALSDALNVHIRALHQEAYYEAPRFHISIAWALLQEDEHTIESAISQELLDPPPMPEFPRVAELPDSLIRSLENRYAARIRDLVQSSIDTVEIKIGKSITRCRLDA